MAPSDLKIKNGLSLFDCQDHHAILGVPIHSDQKVIRKRYLRIARMLHPDSVGERVDKQTASNLLSKLINPSYEFISQSSQREEYSILLKLVGQRYSQDLNRVPLKSSEAKDLLKAQEYESVYQSAVESLAKRQFDQLGEYLDITGRLSELNLVYLYRQDGAPPIAQSASRSTQSASPSTAQKSVSPRTTSSRSTFSKPQPTAAPQPTPESSSGIRVNYDLVDQYYRRAEELIAKSCYLEAVRELKEVVDGPKAIDPQNSKVYTLLGNIYKDYMKQPVMAKPYYTKALKADPNNAEAKRKLSEIPASQPRANAGGSPKNAPKEKKKSGLFGFLSRKK